MSFFGRSSSTDNKPKPQSSSIVLATGGSIDDMVLALCTNSNDPVPKVKRQFSESLIDIGRKQPNLVLSTITEYLRANKSKTPKEQRIQLLGVLQKVLDLHRNNMREELLDPMLDLCMSDMVEDKNVVADWQGAASAVLVSLGVRWPDKVHENLLNKFPPGTTPHYFVIFTLGDLATANYMAIVPKLKTTLSRVIPILGSIKQENMKWVFASSMYKFCDAIVNYVVNTSKNKDALQLSLAGGGGVTPTAGIITLPPGTEEIQLASFSGEVFPAYELMFLHWTQSKEAKVRSTTIQAVGSMCALLTPQQFEAQLPKILAGVLGLYKKDKDHFPITMGLSVILNVGVKDGSRVLEPHLNNLLNAIHQLACAPYEAITQADLESTSQENYHELLRCFDIIGKVFTDEVIHFLLSKLDPKLSKTVQTRVGTSNILKHIVTRLVGPQMADKRGLIVSGLKPLLDTEKETKVKMTAAQLIIAMAGHDYLSLEGGEHLVEFVVKQCAIPEKEVAAEKAKREKEKNPPAESLDDLRSMSDNILNLAATTIPCMEDVLWPYLLELVVPPQYTGAVPVMSKSIAYIAGKKKASEDASFVFDFEEYVNIPKPPEIVARFLVLLTQPFRRGNLGMNILQALHAIGPVLDASIGKLWDTTIPKLAKYLQSKSAGTEPFDGKAWEDLVLRLLSETLKVIDNDQWSTNCAIALCKHLDTYNGDSEMKKSCFKHIGYVLQKLSKKDFIKEKLNEIFPKVNHEDETERVGCAQGFGYCSASHLDMVLEKINNEVNGTGAPAPASTGGFWGSSSSAKKPAGEPALNTIMLCYGYVAAYSSPSLITTRIDINVLNNMKPVLENPKSTDRLKQSTIKALDLIGQAMKPEHLGGVYKLMKRDELIGYLLNFMCGVADKKGQGAVKGSNQTIVLGLNAIATFVELEPRVPLDLESAILAKVVPFYSIDKPATKEKTKSAETPENDAKAVEAMMENLNNLYSSILSMDLSIGCISRIFEVVEPYLTSTEPVVRERAVTSVLFLLKKFIELVVGEKNKKNTGIVKAFTKVGYYIAMMTPRCTDPEVSIRQKSVEAIGMMLYIDCILRGVTESEEGLVFNMQPSPTLRPINGLRDKISATEINHQYAVVQAMSGIVGELVSDVDLIEFLRRILVSLTDVEANGANGSCVVLNGVIKRRGKELKDKTKEFIQKIIEQMQKIKSDQTLNATLHAIRNLALHHDLVVVDTLLEYPIPHITEVVKSFQVVAKDDTLVVNMINHFTTILNNGLLEESGTGKPGTPGKPRPIALSATAAFGEIMEIPETAKAIESRYSQIVCCLLLRIGTSNGNADAMKQIVTSFQKFIKNTKNERLEELMNKEDRWKKLEGAEYHKVVVDMVAKIVTYEEVTVGEEEETIKTEKNHDTRMSEMYKIMFEYLKGNYNGQRVIAATTIGEILNHTKDANLVQNCVNGLMLSLYDPVVKLHCLVGLGNIASAGKVEVDRYAATVLGALIAMIDNEDQNLALESMSGLSKIFEIVDESQVAPNIINLCHRVRPSLSSADSHMRQTSFTLFGTLSRFGNYQTAVDVFHEQIHLNMPVLIMHVNDPDTAVQDASKKALRRLGPLLRFKPMETFLASSATDEGKTNYEEFLDEMARLIIAGFPDRINYYIMTTIEFFKSNWTELRGNANTFVGFLLHHLPAERRGLLNVPMITQALIAMFKEKDADVRRRCAQAMGLLYEY